jgi:hypothetical protein
MIPRHRNLVLLLVGIPVLSGATIAILGGATALGLWSRWADSKEDKRTEHVVLRIAPTSRVEGTDALITDAVDGLASDDAAVLWASFSRAATLPIAERLWKLSPGDPRLEAAISAEASTTGARLFLLRSLAAMNREAALHAARFALEKHGSQDEALRVVLTEYLARHGGADTSGVDDETPQSTTSSEPWTATARALDDDDASKTVLDSSSTVPVREGGVSR